MARPAADITGRTFGRLFVVRKTTKKLRDHFLWECRCECGATAHAIGSELANGHKSSCGCARRDASKVANLQHGLSRTKAYASWRRMMERCYNPDDQGYPNYGGRGVYVHKAWHDVTNFYKDMGDAPGKGREWSIDRKDPNGHYVPGNVRWVKGQQVQNRNKRNHVYLEFRGERRLFVEWADIFKINHETLRTRLESGMSTEEALTKPTQDLIEYRGERKTAAQWARETGIDDQVITRRFRSGLPLEKVFSTEKGIGAKYSFRGESFRLSEWSARLGIDEGTLRARLRRGWSLDKTFSTPV